MSPHDLWCYNSTGGGPCSAVGGHPATHLVNPDRCEPKQGIDPYPANATGCKYEDELFTELAVDAIARHAARSSDRDPNGEGDGEGKGAPLFLFFAPHAIHSPFQIPRAYYDDPHFAGIDDHNRRAYHAMVKFADDAVGRVVAALKAAGMYEDTLIVLR